MTIVNKTNTTIYSLIVDTINKTGTKIYRPMLGSTLNEKYNILIDSTDDEIPALAYYGVGLSPIPILDNSTFDLYKYQHSQTSTDLFRPVPFLVRDITIGLTIEEEEMYRMKVVKQIGTKTYILCYLKKVDIVETDPTVAVFELGTSNNYVMSIYDPTTDSTKNVPVNNDSSKFIGVSQNITLTLSDTEIANIKEAVALLYPTLTSEMTGQYIGELAVYHGVDKPEQNNEAAKVQPAYFIQRHFSLDSKEFKYILNIGGNAPRIFG